MQAAKAGSSDIDFERARVVADEGADPPPGGQPGQRPRGKPGQEAELTCLSFRQLLTDTPGLRRPANEDSYVVAPRSRAATSWPTAWAATPPAKSRRASPSRRSRPSCSETDGVGNELHLAVPLRPRAGASTATASSRRCGWRTARIAQRGARRTRAARHGDDGGVLAARDSGSGTRDSRRQRDAPNPEPRTPNPGGRFRLSSRTSATAASTCGATEAWIRSRTTTRGSRSRSRGRADAKPRRASIRGATS